MCTGSWPGTATVSRSLTRLSCLATFSTATKLATCDRRQLGLHRWCLMIMCQLAIRSCMLNVYTSVILSTWMKQGSRMSKCMAAELR